MHYMYVYELNVLIYKVEINNVGYIYIYVDDMG